MDTTRREPRPTRAAQRLRKRLAKENMTLEDLAERLGVTRQAVARWMSGEGRPAPPQMRRLRDDYGITADAWLEEAP